MEAALQSLVDAVSSPLLIVSTTGEGAIIVEAANDLALRLLRPDTAFPDLDRGSLAHTDLSELLHEASGELQLGCITDCTVRLPSGTTVAVKCDCRKCEILGHALMFVNLWPGVSEPDEDEEQDRLEEEEEEARMLQQVKIRSLNILLVEDDTFSVKVILELCKKCDFSVTVAEGGEDALRVLREDSLSPAEKQINLVLCDVMMHGMDGMDVLERIREEHGDRLTVIMISTNDQQEMVEGCIRKGADSYLFKPLRRTDFSHIWQFVMQQQVNKLRIKHSLLKAERSELNYQRWQQFTEIQRMQTEKQRALAMAQAEQEKALRNQAQAQAERQRSEQEAKMNLQREEMQKRMMKLLHQQVQRYWLLAKMCNDVIVHASATGLFVYASPTCKAMLGYQPNELAESQLLGCVHPEDMRTLREVVDATKAAAPEAVDHSTLPFRLVSIRLRAKDGTYVELKLPMHPVTDVASEGAVGMIGALPRFDNALSTAGGVGPSGASDEDIATAATAGVPQRAPDESREQVYSHSASGGGFAGCGAGCLGQMPPRKPLTAGSSQSLSRLLAEAFSAVNGSDKLVADEPRQLAPRPFDQGDPSGMRRAAKMPVAPARGGQMSVPSAKKLPPQPQRVQGISQMDEVHLAALDAQERMAAARRTATLNEDLAADAMLRFFSGSRNASADEMQEFNGAGTVTEEGEQQQHLLEQQPADVEGMTTALRGSAISSHAEGPAPSIQPSASSVGDVGRIRSHDELEEAEPEGTNEVGALKLQVMRNYFVPRDRTQFSILSAAVYFGEPGAKRVDTVRRLLESGMPIEAGGPCGWQPLNLALTGGDANIGVVRVLLQLGANVEAIPQSLPHQTPLLLAAAARQERCVLALLEARASVHVRNKEGDSVLALCAEWTPDTKARRACEALLSFGADPTARCIDGSTAEARAMRIGNTTTLALLQERASVAAELATEELLLGESIEGLPQSSLYMGGGTSEQYGSSDHHGKGRKGRARGKRS
tara:strand:- start:12 stop:3008 length:2997 start_codon:yes stop_codon:yes gene_type:complete